MTWNLINLKFFLEAKSVKYVTKEKKMLSKKHIRFEIRLKADYSF